MPLALRLVIWAIIAFLVTVADERLFALLFPLLLKAHLRFVAETVLPISVNLLVAWALGLLHFGTRASATVAVSVIIVTLLMRVTAFVLFMVAMTVFCGIANGHAGHYVCGM